MAFPSWPTSLPQFPEPPFADSMSLDIQQLDVEDGLPFVRVQDTGFFPIDLIYLMNGSQYQTLVTFIQTTLLKATSPFRLPYPGTGTLTDVQIIPNAEGRACSRSYRGLDFWEVSIRVMVLKV